MLGKEINPSDKVNTTVYNNGYNIGKMDKQNDVPAKYLDGDDIGADSDQQSLYIKGYISGYDAAYGGK